MSAIVIRVKGSDLETQSEFGDAEDIDALHQSAQEICGEVHPCVAILMHMRSDGGEGQGPRVFIRDNVVHIIRQCLDIEHYRFLSRDEIGMLQRMAKMNIRWSPITDALGDKRQPTGSEEESFSKFPP